MRYLVGMERRTPRHDPDDVQCNIWMPRKLRADLRRVAKAQEMTVAQILRGYARYHVEQFDAEAVGA